MQNLSKMGPGGLPKSLPKHVPTKHPHKIKKVCNISHFGGPNRGPGGDNELSFELRSGIDVPEGEFGVFRAPQRRENDIKIEPNGALGPPKCHQKHLNVVEKTTLGRTTKSLNVREGYSLAD